MSNDILSSLLIEYEYKKRKAELDLDIRKKKLYKQIPKLQEIEDKLYTLSLNNAKNILLGKSDSFNYKNEVELLKKEKENILKQNNISSSFLQPNYECNYCKDTGYIQHLEKESQICHCLKQRLLDISYNKSNISNLSNENFEKFNENIFSDVINVKKYQMNVSPRQNILGIKQKCIEFINNFDNPNYKNLLFTGNTGLGKTFMSNCIANELIKRGKNVLYQTAPVLLETIIDNKMNKYKTSSQENFYKNVLESDFLIIDDLGTECINTMKLSELFTILNTRLLNLNNKITKTLISTNLGINNIFSIYEERIGSRIAGFYDIYYFFGEDLRLIKKL